MIHLFINAVAGNAGGGLTYLRNFIPQLARRANTRATVLLSADVAANLSPQLADTYDNIQFEKFPPAGTALRFLREQTLLPYLIRRSGADVLLSTGNFALRNSPVPQILLSRNALYTSTDFYRDLLGRREYRLWIGERLKALLAMRSLAWAGCTVAPSQAFADDLKRRTGQHVVAIHHGFDQRTFAGENAPPSSLLDKLRKSPGTIRLLCVSHYNYYRNFETLLRALPLIQRQVAPRRAKLFLTCDLHSNPTRGTYRSKSAVQLIKELGLRDDVVELGAVPYQHLHHLYKACDLYVTAAYAESFAHPLVEAMSVGLPVVASDLPVHREICERAAAYFPKFSPGGLADSVAEIANSPARHAQLSHHGIARSQNFSWSKHVDAIMAIAQQLGSVRASRPALAYASAAD